MRQLYVLTGTIRVEGGERYEQEKQDEVRGAAGRSQFTVVQRREISKDRLAGNVIATEYSRRVRQIRLLKTPYGALIAPETLPTVKAMLDEATKDVVTFNAKWKKCHLTNCMLWEKLRGNRLAAVEGWITRRLEAEDPAVVTVSLLLVEQPAVTAAAG